MISLVRGFRKGLDPITMIRPDPYRCPDRAKWQAKHPGAQPPYPVEAGADLPQSLLDIQVERAADLVRQDWSELSTEEVHRLQNDMDIIGDEIAANHGTEEIVFFDPDERRFWVYPEE